MVQDYRRQAFSFSLAEIKDLKKFQYDFHTLTLQNSARVLTTDSESFKIHGGHEDIVSLLPFDSFLERIEKKLHDEEFDYLILSSVFFNSGLIFDKYQKLSEILKEKKTTLVLNVTYALFQTPLELNDLPEKSLVVVEDPFCLVAKMQSLANLINFYETNHLNPEDISRIILQQQNHFREELLRLDHPLLAEKNIIAEDFSHHGSLFAFALPSPAHARMLQTKLEELNIYTDVHLSRLIFHFGLHLEGKIDLSQIKY